MNKRKLTRSLMAACSVVAITAVMYGCGGGGGGDAEAPAMDTSDMDAALGAAQLAAMTAATAADTAADTAETAVADVMANSSADAGSYAVANNAAMRARTAADEAQAASATAAATMDTAVAEAQQVIAEAKQAVAVAEQANAEMYAGMVADAHQAILDEIERQMDVADARTAAMGSYMTADADATKAQMQADDAETTAPGSPGAATAQTAATAARTAANAAKAAHDAITDEMTKEEADAQAAEAATQAGHANAGYLTAMEENDDIQTTGSQITENNRQNAVTAARKYGGAAAENAKQSATGARTAANAAKSAYDDANAEYVRAKSARTDSTNAKKYADAARAAYTAANSAAGDAHAAYVAAKAAVDSVMDDTSLEDATTARDTAEAQEGIAAGHLTTAMTQQTAAEGAETKATMYADSHVVGLLRMANASHITTAADPDANLDETEVGLIEKNRLDHVANVNMAVKEANDDSTDPSHGGGTVTATYPHSATVANADADEDTERTGKPLISVDPDGDGGDAVALRHAGPGALPDDAADDLTDNFVQGPGLGDFVHEKYISGLDDATDDLNDANNQRIILFTDLTQATEPKDGTSEALDNRPVSGGASRVAITANPEGTGAQGPGNTTPRMFAGNYDHDGNPATPAYMGNFICVIPSCSYSLSGTNADNEFVEGETTVTALSGYNFTGTRTTVPMAPMEDTTWLAFGVWLTETAGEDDAAATYDFGAFADGGDAVTDNMGEVTGDATYRGKAAGVHSTATAVDFFHADATLNAKFGDGTVTGTITGMIHNIMAAGRSVDGNIELVVSDPGAADPTPNIDADGSFDGRARMGNTGEQDSSGEDIYRMTGTWDGNFYNHMADDGDTDDVMENTRGPGSAAGTFGVGRADSAATMDVDETESYVGAFGAHCSGSNCNPN